MRAAAFSAWSGPVSKILKEAVLKRARAALKRDASIFALRAMSRGERRRKYSAICGTPQPATRETAREPDQEQSPEEARYGGETILVVDDEAAIRQMIVDSLSPFGYKLLGAANGEEALRLAEQFSGTIDLLLTDLVMPGMYGTELAERILQKWPATRILFMSGYLDARDDVNELVDAGKNFLAKPIMPSTLMKKLREMIG